MVAGGSGAEAAEALEYICRRYWQPARKFLVSLGCGPAEAEDLTQNFFIRWTRGENLRRLDPAQGRLRSYLRQALRREFINDWHRRRHRPDTRIPHSEMEADFAAEPSHAEALYDVAWAEAVVAAVMIRLRGEYAERGRADLFAALCPYLLENTGLQPYAEIAVSAGVSVPTIKLEVHRLRRRFAARLRQEVAATLADPAEVEDELRHLMRVLAHAGVEPDAC